VIYILYSLCLFFFRRAADIRSTKGGGHRYLWFHRNRRGRVEFDFFFFLQTVHYVYPPISLFYFWRAAHVWSNKGGGHRYLWVHRNWGGRLNSNCFFCELYIALRSVPCACVLVSPWYINRLYIVYILLSCMFVLL